MPNPARDRVQVMLNLETLDASEQWWLELRDISGRLVLRQKLEHQVEEHTLDLSRLPSGAYTASLVANDGTRIGRPGRLLRM